MREKTISILNSLSWSIQPKMGQVKGAYYREEGWFTPHPGDSKDFYGVLEAVSNDGKLQMVEFNEFNAPTYYIRKYQNASKRYSDYAFLQASRERTASTHVVLVNGMTYVEEQMMRENRLDGAFDLLTGASNSIRESMLVLAEKISERLHTPSPQSYYGLAKAVEPGITGRLQVVTEKGKIVSCFYDEIFADYPEEIENPELKPYYRQSKYYSLDYVSDYPCGFNALFDMWGEHVLKCQNLMDLSGLRFSQGEFLGRAWGNYLKVAGELWNVLLKDGVLVDKGIGECV